MRDKFHSFALKDRGGGDTYNALKALVSGETQMSSNGRIFGHEEFESEVLEEEHSTQIPFDNVTEARDLPDIISSLERFASYRENNNSRYNTSKDDEEGKEDVLQDLMNEVNPVFQDYVEDRNIPYSELEQELPEVPEEIEGSEIQQELEELRDLIKARREDISNIELRPLSLVELYKVPRGNSAVAGVGRLRKEIYDGPRVYTGVKPERLDGLDPEIVSRVDVPVNSSNELPLFTLLPGEQYMEEAKEIVESYGQKLED